MDAAQFRDSSVGRLVPTVEGQQAFVPAPLPQDLEIDRELILPLDEASRAVAMLSGVGETLVNPHLLIRPFLHREAVLSSRIEGTQASLSDLYLFEASGERKDQGDAREVANYVRAVERGQELLESLPICNRLVREMHAELLRGVRGEEKRPGEWRPHQVWIAPEGTPIQNARFVPAPHTELPALMSDWERFVNEAERLPPLVACALMHYQFEAIHPFEDGNGRIGRALITLYLIAKGVLTTPLLYLSAYFERRRQAYYDHLLSVSATGDWTPWLHFFLEGVAEQAKDALARSRGVWEVYERYRERLQERRESANAMQLLDELFARPFASAPGTASRLGLSNAGARRILERLVDAGIVETVPDSWPRLYVARELLRLVEAPTAESAHA